ncbi:MAG: hypothetical protein JXA83_02870 [Acidimicrobiales bacterium]|nr:hypothetical protein [Acidimicrobiales bacterium]
MLRKATFVPSGLNTGLWDARSPVSVPVASLLTSSDCHGDRGGSHAAAVANTATHTAAIVTRDRFMAFPNTCPTEAPTVIVGGRRRGTSSGVAASACPADFLFLRALHHAASASRSDSATPPAGARSTPRESRSA